MKTLRNLTFTLAMATAGLCGYAQSGSLTPDFIVPNTTGANVIHGLSNNGLYGVASIKAGEDGGDTNTVGAVFFDLTGTSPKATSLGNNGHYSANDVTDDGKMVVGVYGGKPAVCVNNGGKWTWKTLPFPKESIYINDYTEEVPTKKKITVTGGMVSAVTPDGKYAVGRLGSDQYFLYERAIMWDLTDLDNVKEIEIPNVPQYGRTNPKTGSLDENNQTRFLQLSDDGNYILGWTNFSFGGEDVMYVIDRKNNNEIIYVNYIKGENEGEFTPRFSGYNELDVDGVTKSLTSDGHYVTGGIVEDSGNTYPFLFDVWKKELKILKDGINHDANGWSVTKDGLVLGATPASTPYANGLICTEDFFFTFAGLYRDVYGVNVGRYGIDNTGKPTLVSDDGRTIVFVTEQNQTYALRLKEDLEDAVQRINLMSGWAVSPAANSTLSTIQSVVFTFENPVEVDPSKYAEVTFKDSKGTLIATPLANAGLAADGVRLTVSFRSRALTEGETYTLTLPEGICWVKGRPNDTNKEIKVNYKGRSNRPVEVTSISPKSGSQLASLDLNENPVTVKFDTSVKINGTATNRPLAHLYIDGAEESAAPLNLDVDLYTNSMVIYPANTIYLYKGSNYKIVVPQGAVTDISGNGPNAEFSIEYEGSYVPQLGDELYLFKSTCDDFTNFIFYEGDHGTPTDEYVTMGFENGDQYPWWVVMDEGVEDMAFASHSCYVDGRQSDDWVATRQIKMPDDVTAYLSFQGQSYRKDKNDVLKVYVYENNTSMSQFTSTTIADIRKNGDLVFNERLSPGATEANLKDEWTDYIVDLTPYQGKNIYICFVNENQNQSMVVIDNIFVVKNINAYITLTGATDVVAQESAEIKGMISVMSELADYSTLSMTLLDGKGNKVSEFTASDIALKGGDTYNFAFPDLLPIVVGEENPFTIEYKLDDDASVYEGVIRNLSFQTTKRVVLEEQTGKHCQFCPLGLAAMERLESLYGDKLIPVALHVYNGTDPKGANMLSYASSVFMGSTAAPMGRINRRPTISSPMVTVSGGYTMTNAGQESVEPLWQDEVVSEFNVPSFLDVIIEPINTSSSEVSYVAKVKSALNLDNQNVRVLGIVLEDQMLDQQESGVYATKDPLLGEFGEGGLYGSSSFLYFFNNVARTYWGQSTNGTGGLLPSKFEAGKEYEVDIQQRISGYVDKADNVKMAVILIDGNTGRVINAAVSPLASGVDNIGADSASDIQIINRGGDIKVTCADEMTVEIFSLDGRRLASARGLGEVDLRLDGYKGVAIVNATAAGNRVSKKVIL